MARQLRLNLFGGWYLIQATSIDSCKLFRGKADKEKFLFLLETMLYRYSINLHAWVLLPTSYLLLIETPHGNASEALQWLNVLYARYYNDTYLRRGPLFSGRFHSLPLQPDNSRLWEAFLFTHSAPLRIRKRRAARNIKKRTNYTVSRAIWRLKNHQWSSYLSYLALAEKPEWLHCDYFAPASSASASMEIDTKMRHYLKAAIDLRRDLNSFVILGQPQFAEAARKALSPTLDSSTNAKQWRKLLTFETITKAVETVKKRKWRELVDLHNDDGRDIALWVGRLNSGLSVSELAKKIGIGTSAASKALSRMRERLQHDKAFRSKVNRVSKIVGVDNIHMSKL